MQLAMVNISHRLEQLSIESDGWTRNRTLEQGPRPFRFRRSRSCPGGAGGGARGGTGGEVSNLPSSLDDVRPILQVHDELLFEVREDLLEKVRCVSCVMRSF